METFITYIKKQITILVDEVIRLGPVDFRLVSNIPEFAALQYFSEMARSAYHNQETKFELWCISLDQSGLDPQYIKSHVDHSYRGNSFLSGYYVTDHFGLPLYLVSHEERFFVFGEQLERVVWPYFVKYFLMLHSIKDESLYLKSAAVMAGSAGTLLLGRGGAGKTVFLTQLCQHGARFVSNSHVVIKDLQITGIASSLRVRQESWFSNLIDGVRNKPALKPDELIIDPYDIFDAYIDDSVTVKNLCIIDFKRSGHHEVKELSEQEAYSYAEQFSLAINVYRLEEDLLDLYRGDYQQFSQTYSKMKTQLHDLIRRTRRYYISSDVLETTFRQEVFDLLLE